MEEIDDMKIQYKLQSPMVKILSKPKFTFSFMQSKVVHRSTPHSPPTSGHRWGLALQFEQGRIQSYSLGGLSSLFQVKGFLTLLLAIGNIPVCGPWHSDLIDPPLNMS